MSPRDAVHRLITLFLALWALPGLAQATPVPSTGDTDMRWDCWVSSDSRQKVVGYAIRCIRDRAVPTTDPIPDSLQAILLDLVHEHIHQGEAIAIDQDLSAGRLAEVSKYIKQIRIHQYPYESSWEDGRPKQLIESVLCRGASECAVVVIR